MKKLSITQLTAAIIALDERISNLSKAFNDVDFMFSFIAYKPGVRIHEDFTANAAFLSFLNMYIPDLIVEKWQLENELETRLQQAA